MGGTYCLGSSHILQFGSKEGSEVSNCVPQATQIRSWEVGDILCPAGGVSLLL